MRPRTVTVGQGRVETRRDGHRVTAEVGGHDVWFESPDISLQASPEALGSAFLIPSFFRGRRLQLNSEMCPTWLAGAGSAAALAAQWWQVPRLMPDVRPRSAPLPAAPDQAALCFSGGLDSFYSLLRGGHRPALLVFVHGFDIRLGDADRLQAYLPSFRRIAAECGAKPVLVRTNLREHPVFTAAHWKNSHGGALAAIGHLLNQHVSRLVIASSIPRSYDIPLGSHWQLDPCWSSGALTVLHDGADFSREEKAWELAHEPLLAGHLRVCWENRAPTGNCSVCDKCVNTMLLLQQAGRLASCTVFRPPPSFAPLLDALPHTTFIRGYRAMCRRGLPPDVVAAVERLLRRTGRREAWRSFRRRVRSSFKRLLFRCLSGS